MTNLLRFRRALAIAALVVAALTLSASEALATHFRYGTFTWSVQNPAQPNVVTIRFDSVWRRSFAWQTLSNSPRIITSSGYNIQLLRANGTALPTAVGLPQNPIPLAMTVTSENITEDWIATTFQTTVTLPMPVAPATIANYIVRFDNCCRLSTLLPEQNRDTTMRVEAGITVSATAPPNRPPVAASLPIIKVPYNQQTVNFTLPAFDPDAGDVLSFRASTVVEIAGSLTPDPQFPVPPGMTIDPATGVVTWSTRPAPAPNPVTLNALYMASFRVTDAAGAFTVVDVLIQPVNAVGQAPTVALVNQTAPYVFNVVRGQLLMLTVRGIDPEAQTVTLNSSPLPPGAVMTPALPTSSASGTVQSTFNWTPPANAIGSYVVQFSVVDGNGASATTSATINVTNVPPTVQCTTSGSPIEATGPDGGAWGVTATAVDAENDPLSMRLLVDGIERQAFPNAGSPSTRQFTAATYALGAHAYEVRATDGISSVSCTGTFEIVDTTAPALMLPPDATIDATSPAGAPYTFAATASDAVDPAPAVTCTPASGSTFPIGTSTVACTAADGSGNDVSGTFTVLVKDPTAPVITPTITGTLGDNGWYRSDVTVSWTTIDEESGIATSTGCDATTVLADTGSMTFTCSATNGEGLSATASVEVKRDATAPVVTVSGALSAEAAGASGAVVSFAPASAVDALSGVAAAAACNPSSGATFALGTTEVTCSATDNAGNAGSASFQVTVADTTAPVLVATADQTVEALSAAGAPFAFALPSALDAVDASPIVECVPGTGTFPLGQTLVACTATDDAGNVGRSSFTVSVVDTTAPTIATNGPLAVTLAGSTTTTVTFAPPPASDSVAGPLTAVCAPASGTSFGLGTTTVTCTATDTFGNSAGSSFDVVVSDVTAPVITPVVNGLLGAGGWYRSDVVVSFAVVDLESAATSTGCDAVTVSQDTNGTTFSCSATSAGGSATASVTVTRDATAPLLTTAANLSVPAVNASGAAVTYAAPTAVDAASGLATVACAPASGTQFALGSTTVTCTAADVAGNVATGSFTVTVADTTAPAIVSVTPSTTTLWSPNHQMVPVTIATVANDNLGAPVCAVASVASNEAVNGNGDGNTAPDWAITGRNTVDLRAERAGSGSGRVYTITVRCTDAAGNATTGTTQVAVPKSKGK